MKKNPKLKEKIEKENQFLAFLPKKSTPFLSLDISSFKKVGGVSLQQDERGPISDGINAKERNSKSTEEKWDLSAEQPSNNSKPKNSGHERSVNLVHLPNTKITRQRKAIGQRVDIRGSQTQASVKYY